MRELADVIAHCYDARTGRVHIPGFYDDVRSLSADDLDNFLSSGFDVAAFKEAHGLLKLRTEEMRQVVQAIWSQPTFEVHGLHGGYQGPGIKTIMPHMAEAKGSMRLVPDQDPERLWTLVQTFIRRHNPEVEVIRGGFLQPYLGAFSGFYGEAVRDALRFGFGQAPSFIREGGSIGAVVTLD